MKTSENFPVASLLVRPSARPSMAAFYAFARQADDVADDPQLESGHRLARLARFERGLDGDPEGEAAALWLSRLLTADGRPAAVDHGRTLLAAFRMDAEKSRYRSWAELRAYCRLSADPVGRFILDIHDEGPDTYELSDALCTALQILNHLQDLRDDYVDLGRIYLPLDWLECAGGRERDVDEDSSSPALRTAIDRTLTEVRVLCEHAAPLPARLHSRRLAGEVRSILWLANRLRQKLERQDPLARRVALSRVDFARAAAAGVAECMRPSRRLRAGIAIDGPA